VIFVRVSRDHEVERAPLYPTALSHKRDQRPNPIGLKAVEGVSARRGRCTPVTVSTADEAVTAVDDDLFRVELTDPRGPDPDPISLADVHKRDPEVFTLCRV
jgi:hypothetical protein